MSSTPKARASKGTTVASFIKTFDNHSHNVHTNTSTPTIRCHIVIFLLHLCFGSDLDQPTILKFTKPPLRPESTLSMESLRRVPWSSKPSEFAECFRLLFTAEGNQQEAVQMVMVFCLSIQQCYRSLLNSRCSDATVDFTGILSTCYRKHGRALAGHVPRTSTFGRSAFFICPPTVLCICNS